MRWGRRWSLVALIAFGCSAGAGPAPADSAAGDTGMTLSCADACAKVVRLCPSITSSVWADACTESCHNKMIVKAELAATETACVAATEDCDTAIACVSDLPGATTDAGGTTTDAASPDAPAGVPDAGRDSATDPPRAPDGGDAPADRPAGGDAPADAPGVETAPPPPPMGQLLATSPDGKKPRAIMFTPDGDRLIYSLTAGDGTIGDLWSWSFSGGKATHIHDGVFWLTAHLTADGNVFFIADPKSYAEQGSLILYDFASAKETVLSTLTNDQAVKLSPDRKRVAYADGYDSLLLTPGSLKVWTFADGAAQTVEAKGGGVRAWSPDSQRFAYFVGSALNVWDARQNAKTPVAPLAYGDAAVGWSPKSDKIAYQLDLNVQVFDVGAQTTVSGKITSGIDQVAFSGDGRQLFFRTSTSGNNPAISVVDTTTGVVTSLGAGNMGPLNPDGTVAPLFLSPAFGRSVLHFRTIATGADQTIASSVMGTGIVWSADGAQAAFVTNDGTANATATLRLWTAGSATPRSLTAAAPGPVQNYVSFVNGGARLVYAAFAAPGGTPKTMTLTTPPDLYMMDLASSTAQLVGRDLFGQYAPSTVSYLSADGKCGAFTWGYDVNRMLANVASLSLTGPLATAATTLDFAATYWPIAVSAKRAAYVIGTGVYARSLACAAP